MRNYPGVGGALERFAHPELGAEATGFHPLDAAFPPLALIRARRNAQRRKQSEDDDASGEDDCAAELGRDDDIAADEATGSHGQHTASRISDIQSEIKDTERKMRDAKSDRRRRHLSDHLRTLKSHLKRKQTHLSHKLTHAVQSGKMSPAAAAAIAAGAGIAGGAAIAAGASSAGSAGAQPGTGGYPSMWGQVAPFTGQALPESLRSKIERSPPGGDEIRIPMLISSAPVALVTVAAGAGLRTVALAATTATIPYAGFQVTGLDVILSVATGENAAGFANQDILITVLVSNYQVSGEKNLLYGTQNASFAGQELGNGTGGRRTIAGLRENQVMQPTNTITLDAVFRQEITTAVAYNSTVQFASVMRTLWDPAAGIGPVRN